MFLRFLSSMLVHLQSFCAPGCSPVKNDDSASLALPAFIIGLEFCMKSAQSANNFLDTCCWLYYAASSSIGVVLALVLNYPRNFSVLPLLCKLERDK